jgi:hypothetical protein
VWRGELRAALFHVLPRHTADLAAFRVTGGFIHAVVFAASHRVRFHAAPVPQFPGIALLVSQVPRRSSLT